MPKTCVNVIIFNVLIIYLKKKTRTNFIWIIYTYRRPYWGLIVHTKFLLIL